MHDAMDLDPVEICDQAIHAISSLRNDIPGADGVLLQTFAELNFVEGRTTSDAFAFLQLAEMFLAIGILNLQNGDKPEFPELFETTLAIVQKAMASLVTHATADNEDEAHKAGEDEHCSQSKERPKSNKQRQNNKTPCKPE